MPGTKRLNPLDASWLAVDSVDTPMHVGSLMLFDLPEGYQGDYHDDVKAQIAKRLHLARIHYFLYYRVLGEEVQVLRIWHTSRGTDPKL